MKGQTPAEELAAVNAETTLISINVPNIDAERCLVKLTHLKS